MPWQSSAPARHPFGFVEPCLPTLGDTLPNGREWAYEIKHDGYRFICSRSGDRVRHSPGRADWTDRVPLIIEALRALQVLSVTLDGEAVSCGANGITDFDGLRRNYADTAHAGLPVRLRYPWLDGRDLRTTQWMSVASC
jgi:bifunctional non-homologous end joining protein LigD